jgi:hypothetical protein
MRKPFTIETLSESVAEALKDSRAKGGTASDAV